LAERTEKYKGINQTLLAIREQIVDSYDYCSQNLTARTPEGLFNLIKANVVYRNDPKGIELLQTSQTMFENNYHGIRGAGDCDCFTITALAALMVNGFTDNEIVLAGRTNREPSHIYCRTFWNNEWKVLDLTEPFYNQERKYKYKQTIRI
jgi:hypothetical protein